MIRKDILKKCSKQGFNKKELYQAYKVFFRTLVSESRLKIINLLRDGKKNVSEITKHLNMDQSAVSHDLRRLKNCGFVKAKINGKYRDYELNKDTIKPLMNLIDEHMAGNCIHILRKNKEQKLKRRQDQK